MRVSPLAALLVAILAPTTALAQGLVWSLPAEDGAYARFRGKYRQVMFDPTGNRTPTIEDAESSYDCPDPDNPAGSGFAEVVCWDRSIEVRSVGREPAMFRGKEVECRWIEIKTVTGVDDGAGIVPGPTGIRIQKVLIPEKEIVGGPVDSDGIPVSFLPVVKGFQKIGNAEVKPVSGVLQVYPMLTMVAQYRRVDADPAAGDPGLEVDAGTTSAVKGEIVVESKSDRSRNTATLWRSDTIPFGLAKWEVTVIREKKDPTASRDRFVPLTRIFVEMRVVKTGTDAVSEIVAPGM